MRKGKSWELVSVSSEIYCSSSCDHFVKVFYKRNGKGMNRDLYIENRDLLNEYGTDLVGVPNYFMVEVKRALLIVLPTARYHEYDRDGNKRYENLRYHYSDWVDWMSGVLKRDLES